jgi:hypothetical protein
MITVCKKLKGVVPYSLIFFPEDPVLEEMADRLPANQVTRVEAASLDLEHGRCLVDHHLCLTLAIDLSRRVEELYKNVAANARIRIHKAERLGDRVSIRRCSTDTGYDEALVDEFRTLYNQLAMGKRGIAWPISHATAESLRSNTDLMLAYLDGQLICGHFNLVDQRRGISRLLYSANRRFEEPKIARLSGIVNCYLHWYEILKYREEGLTSYDFGSIGQIEDGLGVNRFKMQFGGDIVREHNYLLAGMPRLWRTALKLKTSLTPSGRRRQQMERAGDRWRFMPIEQIRSVVESSIQDYEKSLATRNDLRDDTSVKVAHS